MRPDAIVIGGVGFQNSAQMCFAQDDDVVQTLAPDRADRPFGKAVLPAGTRAAKSLSNVQEGGSDSDGVCLVRSRRNDAFFCDLEALVPSHPIGCIIKKTGLRCVAASAPETQ